MHQYHLDAFTRWRFRGRTPGPIEVVSAHGKTQIQRFTVTVEKLPVGAENDTFAYRATINAHSVVWVSNGSITDVYANATNNAETVGGSGSNGPDMQIYLASITSVTNTDSILHA